MNQPFNFDYLAYIIGTVFIFFILRELFTWYLKQNQIVKQNDEIIRLLKKIANEPEENSDPNANTLQNLLKKVNKDKE